MLALEVLNNLPHDRWGLMPCLGFYAFLIKFRTGVVSLIWCFGF